MNEARLRALFPALSHEGRVYLDNAATSLTPQCVISEVARYPEAYGVNAGRGAYRLSAELAVEIEQARERVASFIGADPCEIAFTANTTDSINKLALALDFKSNDRIVITRLEHHSNILPWKIKEKRFGVKVQILPLTSESGIDLDAAGSALKGAKLFAFTAASNVLGTTEPIEELTSLARDNGSLTFIDAAQLVGHKPFNIKKVGCDFAAFSGHKICGPTGVGILYVRKEAQKYLDPVILGGGTIKDVNDSSYVLQDYPVSFEPGTLNISGILGFAEALRFLEETGIETIEERINKLHMRLAEGLLQRKEIEVFTSRKNGNVGITSFNIKGFSPHQAASLYDQTGGILVRSGYHCAIPLVRTLGDGSGTIRASVAFYNIPEEIDRFLAVTDELIKGR